MKVFSINYLKKANHDNNRIKCFKIYSVELNTIHLCFFNQHYGGKFTKVFLIKTYINML